MADPMIEAQKSFGANRILAGLDLEASAGESVGIIGPNGSGKTTLFNLLTGVVSPTAGRIWFCEQDITGWPTHRVARLNIARTFQNLRLFRRMTVFENVWAAQHRLPGMTSWRLLAPNRAQERQRRERVRHLLEITGLLSKAELRVQQLALGEQRRLELARALAREPQLLLLDEPTGGMTPRETDEMAQLLAQVITGGVTVLLIEHKMAMVMQLCQRLVVLNFGQKICEGPPHQVRSDPAVIAAYMGSEADGPAASASS